MVNYISDRVMVMYLGQVAEIGPSDTLFAQPAHPYTKALLSSVPSMDPSNRTQQAPLAGDPPNPINPPSGCRFHPRCPKAAPVCAQQVPRISPVQVLHSASCLIHEAGSNHPLAPNIPTALAA